MYPQGSARVLRYLIGVTLVGHVICSSDFTFSTDADLYTLRAQKRDRARGLTRNERGSSSAAIAGREVNDSSLQVTTASSPKIILYSASSSWAGCVQTRRRHRRKPHRCGNIAFKEKRPCDPKRRRCQKRRRQKRGRNRSFRVVRMSEVGGGHGRRRQPLSPANHHRYELERSGRRSDDFRPRGLYSNIWFGRWCKRPALCGNDYMREVAYCYVEGSFCQRWIYRQIEQQNDEENEGEFETSMYGYKT
ncbi:uncharacterized protein LOC110837078 [Zootermopsis nevadensis]|uniref:uncharacterized protein LOC110837078 n=1 Tax=Zootermopsis nevadensis TaxID=136037 RepID=UPI000B8E54F3|nr:uncharacterized protein LOC110837078 [Zootermopsis nevadensis]